MIIQLLQLVKTLSYTYSFRELLTISWSVCPVQRTETQLCFSASNFIAATIFDPLSWTTALMLSMEMLNFATSSSSHVAILAPVCRSSRGIVASVRVFIFQSSVIKWQVTPRYASVARLVQMSAVSAMKLLPSWIVSLTFKRYQKILVENCILRFSILTLLVVNL